MIRTISTQHSALSTQHSALSTQHSALSLSRLISESSTPAFFLCRHKVCASSLRTLTSWLVFSVCCLFLVGCASFTKPPSAPAPAPAPPEPVTEPPQRNNAIQPHLDKLLKPSVQKHSEKNGYEGRSDAVGNKAEPEEPKANLTPYTTWSNTSPFAIGNDKDFSDAYTRLIITSKLAADGKPETSGKSVAGKSNLTFQNKPADYQYKPRWWLSRWIAGSEFSINFTAKITVGAFEETVPLVTVGHQSNSDGEKWDRVIYHSSKNHPLFLVRRDGHSSTPAVKVTMHGSKSYTSRGASSALQVAIGVANAVAPSSSVVTRFSEQSAKDHSRALDSAISKLFGTDITEEHVSTPDLYSWEVDKKTGTPLGINVALGIPDDEKWDGAKDRLTVGTWTITFDNPRPSIFSDWKICKSDMPQIRCVTKEKAQREVWREIDASEVLNYSLLNEGQAFGTIRAYLAQQDWFSQAQAALVAAKAASASEKPANGATKKIENIAAQMCRRIRNAITGLNLNGFDASIMVWAVMKGMPWPDGAPTFDELKKSGDCKHSIEPIEIAQIK